MLALEMGIPTVTLSDPIYNLAGLTFQGNLDDFWPACQKPEVALFEAFRKVVMHATQVNGGFYCRRGMALAAENASHVLTADVSPLEALL
jgi:capsular polysaccharide export protein